jgi:hypothetical protein
MLRADCAPDRWTHFPKLKAGPHLLLPHDSNAVTVVSSYALCFHLSPPTRMARDGHTQEVKPGHVHIIPPGNELVLALQGEAVRLFCVFLRPDFLAQLAAERSKSPLKSFSPSLAVEDPALYHLGLAFRAAIKESNSSNQLFADSIAEAMGARLLEHYGMGAREISTKLRAAAKVRVERVMAYIDDYLDENFGVDDLAAVAELTPKTSSLSPRLPSEPVSRIKVIWAGMLEAH